VGSSISENLPQSFKGPLSNTKNSFAKYNLLGNGIVCRLC